MLLDRSGLGCALLLLFETGCYLGLGTPLPGLGARTGTQLVCADVSCRTAKESGSFVRGGGASGASIGVGVGKASISEAPTELERTDGTGVIARGQYTKQISKRVGVGLELGYAATLVSDDDSSYSVHGPEATAWVHYLIGRVLVLGLGGGFDRVGATLTEGEDTVLKSTSRFGVHVAPRLDLLVPFRSTAFVLGTELRWVRAGDLELGGQAVDSDTRQWLFRVEWVY